MKRTGKRENGTYEKRLKHFIAAVTGLFAVLAGLMAIGSLLKRKRPCRDAQAEEKSRKNVKDTGKKRGGKASKETGKETAAVQGKEAAREFSGEAEKKSGKKIKKGLRKGFGQGTDKGNARKFRREDRKKSGKKNKKQNSRKNKNNKDSYNNSENYHRKRLKHSLMAATAGVLAVSLIAVSVLTRSIEAEAAETFFGIEKLRNQVAESEREYTILEIVPDRSAAEIGYLFDGYEPILSEWDRDEMKWRSWKEILCSFPTLEERTAFIEKKKVELQAYYDSLELKDKFPVQWGKEAYVESDTPQNGFERCEAEGKERRGWFARIQDGSGITERYRLFFGYSGAYSSVGTQQGIVYYVVDTAEKITLDMAETMSPDTIVYRKIGDGIFVEPQTWAEMLEKGINIAGETEETETTTEETTTEETTIEETTTSAEGTTAETEEETTKEETETATQGETGTQEESSTAVDPTESIGTEPAETESPEESSSPESSETGSTEAGSTETGSSETGSPEQSGPPEESSSSSSAEESSGGENSDSEGGGTTAPEQNTGDQNGEQPAEPENAASEISWRDRSWDRLSAEVTDGASTESPRSPEAGSDAGDSSGTPAQGGDAGTPEESSSAGGGTDTPEESSSTGGGTGTPEESSGAGGGTDTPEESSSAGSGTGTPEESSGAGDGTETTEESDSTQAATETETEIETKTEPAKGTDSGIKADQEGEDSEEGGYYIVTFKRAEGSPAADTSVYAVENIVADGSGEYQFIESDDESAYAQTYFFEGVVIYCKNAFKNNEWFKRYVLNMEESDYESFPVKVISLTPEELNRMEQLPVFDFLYLNSGLRRTIISEVSNTVNNAAGDAGDIGHIGIGKEISAGNNGGSMDGNAGNDGTGDTDSNAGNGGAGSPDGNNGDSGTGNRDSNDGNGGAEGTDGNGGTGSTDGSGGNGGTEGTDDNGGNGGTGSTDGNGGSEGTDGSGGNGGTGGTEGDTGNGNAEAEESSSDTGSTGDTGTGESGDGTESTETEASDGVNDGAGSDETEESTETAGTGESGEDGTGNTGAGEGGSTEETQIGDVNIQYSAGACDLSEATARRLFERIITDALPCLVDGGILYRSNENDGTVVNAEQKNTWVFKLAAVMCQESLTTWLEEHTSGISGISVDNLLAEMVEDDDYNFTTEQVYCKLGDSIINSKFFTPTIYKEGGEVEQGFQNVLDEIELENLFRASDTSGNYGPLPTNISQAEALRHIINYKNRRSVETKKHIKVLEIQPAKADQSELTLEQLQKWAPGVETADITVMTTAEFIGKIEKLNETYDLVYIGASQDHLNNCYWTDKQYYGKPDPGNKDHSVSAGTVFNDSDMDGLIYYNVGDLRAVSMSLAGLLNTEYYGNNRNNKLYYYNFVRYGGNDITLEKERALQSFLDGAYPIIVADDFIEQPATVFSGKNCKGYRINLTTGEYQDVKELKTLGIVASDIASMKVKDGYEVTVYSGANFTGSKKTFTSDVDDLKSAISGVASIKIIKSETEEPIRAVDGDHIDNCTYLYDFVAKSIEEKYTNFYAWSDLQNGSELFKFYLNRPKVSMIQTSANGAKEEGSDIYYISAGINGRYGLEYHFTIQNEGAASMNTRYQCKLYIDVNSDGKYSGQEEVADIQLTQGGSIVSSNDLYAGREYVLTRAVPPGYKGLLPWKVEITQVDNANIYTSMSGYTKLQGMEKERLNIIQIGRDKLTDVNWTGGNNEVLFDLGKEIRTKGTVYNRLVYGGTIDGIYYKGIADEFEIDVTFKTIKEYETEFYKNPDYLKDYNMLILGFSDIYGDFAGDASTGPMGAIVDFINSGKSVLFAHDTTSFFNYPKAAGSYPASNDVGIPWRDNYSDQRSHGDYHNAYSLNKYVRGLVGMDRYGILSQPVLQKGNVLYEGTDAYHQAVSSGKDVAYKPKSNKKETVPQVQGYTYLTINGKDYDAVNTGNQKHEFTRYEIDLSRTTNWDNDFRNIRYDTVTYNYGVTDNGEVVSPYNGEIDDLYVTQVNQGQITEYPYKLKESFAVAQTHGQYYELDYTADDDSDGQSDLVVWYCLGKKGGTAETIYSQSPNDVRNNYYIYNKGNVTYTGMGHSAARDLKYTVEEAKLFINTMIASYQAGVKPPYISVLEKGLPEAREIKTMYRYYDDANGISLSDAATAEANEKIYFTVQDVNFVKGSRTIASHVFYGAADGSETITVGGVDIQVNRLADAMYNASDDSPVDANNLQSGGIYYILVPKSVMQQCDSGLKLYFEAQSTITTNTTTANVYVTDKIYAQLEVLKAYLFELE